MTGEPEPIARALLAAGVLFFDPDGLVLLVKPKYKDGWEVPGGHLLPGESPSAAAVREVAEELGVTTRLGPLLVVDWAPMGPEDRVLFLFDGGVPDREWRERLAPDGVEIGEAAFHPPSRLEELLPARLARRVRAAIAARTAGRTDHLEPGVRS
ncbi:NUDIX hydrolase [Kitasatospora sp. NBC_00240]|uniref:NUDIX domain-containing protein n=1 Tax=Kitasatospora sp. NBC_00240 TaxID=2903567 RepID=UPI00225BBBAF|nr:NUDIX hydrolase [Kitasatospora sp. NBC_00240]MCX5210231.1 NUDIX hydrolase [Kitasatospora sp. NBC_00240]